MKFITPILFVFASTVCANSFNDLFDILEKRDFLGLNCNNEILTIKDCFVYPTINTYEQLCPIVESEKCQQLYTDPFKLIPSCQDVPIISTFFQSSLLDDLRHHLNLSCQKDEAGILCPFSEIMLNKISKILNPITVEQYNKAKESTCQSQICREATFNAYSHITTTTKAFENLSLPFNIPEFDDVVIDKQELANYLDSEECKDMSGASTLNIGFGILISLALLIFSLY